MNVLSLFSGIGGFDLAFEQVGAHVVGQVEIDGFCQRVLKEHFSAVPLWEDVRNVGSRNFPSFDVLCGGFPCQDLSVAGKRAGLDGERSGLFYEIVRILDECTPKWFCLENVPGLLSSKGGADFQAVIETLVEIGYGVAWRVLDAQWFGIPQRRRRVFIVGCLGNPASAAKVLFESESLPWDTPPSRKEESKVADGLARCLKASGGCKWRADSETYIVAGFSAGQGAKAGSIGYREEQAPTLKAGAGLNDVPTVHRGFAVRRLTPTECERLQGFPDGWTAVDGAKDTPRYKAIGNAVAVPVVRWIAERMFREEAEHGLSSKQDNSGDS